MENIGVKRERGISSARLHLLAMCLMLSDHLWGTVVTGNEWMTCVGRIAFPIFAFMIAEGWRKTSDRRAYAKRLLLTACLSEVPYNLMMSGSVFYPFGQNVLWTFLIAIAMMAWIDRARQKGSAWRLWAVIAAAAIVGYLLGYLSFSNYYGAGVLTVLVFYLFPKRNRQHLELQVLCLYLLHVKMLGGLVYEWELGGTVFTLHQQALALLSLIPIWLYRGRQGYRAKWFRVFCYGFYPLHMLVLYLIAYFA